MTRFSCLVAGCLSLCAANVSSAADFTVTITDPAELAGITYAREQHNAALPKNAEGVTVGALATNAAYMEMVMQRAAQSYASTQAIAPLDTARAKCMAGDCADAKTIRMTK